jgi:peptidoglycan biosynthesis protein MviN/MurJ (putative lipid II flippase)
MLPFLGVNLVFQWAFFSLLRAWTAVKVGIANLVFNAVLDLALYKQFGIAGIAWATVAATAATTAILVLIMRRALGTRRIGVSGIAARIAASSLAFAGTALLVWRLIDESAQGSFALVLLGVVASLTAGALAYVLALRVLGVDDSLAAWRVARRWVRLGRRQRDAA